MEGGIFVVRGGRALEKIVSDSAFIIIRTARRSGNLNLDMRRLLTFRWEGPLR